MAELQRLLDIAQKIEAEQARAAKRLDRVLAHLEYFDAVFRWFDRQLDTLVEAAETKIDPTILKPIRDMLERKRAQLQTALNAVDLPPT